ncbi:MAG: exonuclease domain-containing protein [Bacteroidales bacterium]|jgi:DNA polymerase-3 subunit epsilon|nr:exonuclease domain-containing protein [Bacteroidales bacterium]MDD4703494.1 exonuclease domain-containing protein [Bacteroidales bacterium]MDX9798809.1 exonuclease domain-containing protein [Bacteroidales bacterium]
MILNLSKPIIFFDIESTGVVVGQDKIIEISLLKINTNGKEEVRTYRINPECHIPEQATKIHGIKDEDVKDKPTFRQLAGELNAFIGNSDLAGYNSNKFDIPLLIEEFLRNGFDFDISNRRFVDVMNIFHKMESRTLKAAYKFYCGKELVNAHSAEADTIATYEIFLAQLKRYEGVEYEDNEGKISVPIVNDIQSLHEFTRNSNWVDLVGHLVYDSNGKECINFGKYKGRIVEEIFKNDPSYFSWMMNADFPLSTKKIITEIKLRNFSR